MAKLRTIQAADEAKAAIENENKAIIAACKAAIEKPLLGPHYTIAAQSGQPQKKISKTKDIKVTIAHNSLDISKDAIVVEAHAETGDDYTTWGYAINKILVASLHDVGVKAHISDKAVIIPYENNYDKIEEQLRKLTDTLTSKVAMYEKTSFIGSKDGTFVEWPRPLVDNVQNYLNQLSELAQLHNRYPSKNPAFLAKDVGYAREEAVTLYKQALVEYKLPAGLPKSEVKIFEDALQANPALGIVADLILKGEGRSKGK
jgi:hypothetical protein